jgi:hypothetical protein
MPAKNDDLHGNVSDRAEVALLLIDVIDDLEFEGSQPLTEQVRVIAENKDEQLYDCLQCKQILAFLTLASAFTLAHAASVVAHHAATHDHASKALKAD